MTHKAKLHQARQMLTDRERREHISPFAGKAWSAREQRSQKELARMGINS